jgi:hypothetical protein
MRPNSNTGNTNRAARAILPDAAVCSSFSRSSGLNTAGRDFDLDIINSPLAGLKGKGPATGITPQQDRQLAATRY